MAQLDSSDKLASDAARWGALIRRRRELPPPAAPVDPASTPPESRRSRPTPEPPEPAEGSDASEARRPDCAAAKVSEESESVTPRPPETCRDDSTAACRGAALPARAPATRAAAAGVTVGRCAAAATAAVVVAVAAAVGERAAACIGGNTVPGAVGSSAAATWFQGAGDLPPRACGPAGCERGGASRLLLLRHPCGGEPEAEGGPRPVSEPDAANSVASAHWLKVMGRASRFFPTPLLPLLLPMAWPPLMPPPLLLLLARGAPATGAPRGPRAPGPPVVDPAGLLMPPSGSTSCGDVTGRRDVGVLGPEPVGRWSILAMN